MTKVWTAPLSDFRARTGWVGKTLALVLIAGMCFLSVMYFIIVGAWLYQHL